MTEQNGRTPKEQLKQRLASEKAGSPVIKALADKLKLEMAEPGTFKHALIEERIDRRRFGKNGGKYNETWDLADEILQPHREAGIAKQQVLLDLQGINNMKQKKRSSVS